MYFGTQTGAHALGGGNGRMRVGYPFDFTREAIPGVKSFPYTFLGMFTTRVGNCIRDGSRINDEAVETLYFVEPIGEQSNLPRMSLDPERTNLAFGGGLDWDYIGDSISEPAWFTGTIDSLYRGHTVGDHLNDRHSSLDGRVAALRMHYDPHDLSANAQGRTAWFGFPLFDYKTEDVQEMVNTMLDWFLEEAPYVPE